MVVLELEDAGAKVAGFGVAVRNVDAVVDEEEAGIGDGVAGIGRDRGGKDILSELVSLEAVENVLVELVGVDYVERLIDNWFQY